MERTHKTLEEKRALVSKVDELRDNGHTLGEALSESGIKNLQNYRRWKKIFAEEKPTTVIYQAKTKEPKPSKAKDKKLVAVIGTARAIADLLEEMSNE